MIGVVCGTCNYRAGGRENVVVIFLLKPQQNPQLLVLAGYFVVVYYVVVDLVKGLLKLDVFLVILFSVEKHIQRRGHLVGNLSGKLLKGFKQKTEHRRAVGAVAFLSEAVYRNAQNNSHKRGKDLKFCCFKKILHRDTP